MSIRHDNHKFVALWVLHFFIFWFNWDISIFPCIWFQYICFQSFKMLQEETEFEDQLVYLMNCRNRSMSHKYSSLERVQLEAETEKKTKKICSFLCFLFMIKKKSIHYHSQISCLFIMSESLSFMARLLILLIFYQWRIGELWRTRTKRADVQHDIQLALLAKRNASSNETAVEKKPQIVLWKN